MSVETIVSLASHPRIKGLKEASGNIAFASEIIDQLTQAKKNLALLSGDDATYLPFLAVGGTGVISVVSNLFPKEVVALQKAFDSGNFREAQRLHQFYFPLMRDLFIETNPGPIKFGMAYAGLCNERVRLPLVPLSATNKDKVKLSLHRCQIQKG